MATTPPVSMRVAQFDLSNVTEAFVKALEAYASFVRAGAAPSTQQKVEAAWARLLFNRMGLTSLPLDFVGTNEAKGLREVARLVADTRKTLEQNGLKTNDVAAAMKWNDALRDAVQERDLATRRVDGPRAGWTFLKTAFGVKDILPPNVEAIAKTKFIPSRFSSSDAAMDTMRGWMAVETGVALTPKTKAAFDKAVIDVAEQVASSSQETLYEGILWREEQAVAGGSGASGAGGGSGSSSATGGANGPKDPNDPKDPKDPNNDFEGGKEGV